MGEDYSRQDLLDALREVGLKEVLSPSDVDALMIPGQEVKVPESVARSYHAEGRPESMEDDNSCSGRYITRLNENCCLYGKIIPPIIYICCEC